MTSGHVPGYAGYLRNYQRTFVSGAGRQGDASRKYADAELERHGLMADEWRMRSHSSTSYDAARFLAHQQAQPSGSTRVVPLHKDATQAARILAANARATAARPASAGEEKEQSGNGSYDSATAERHALARSLGASSGLASVPVAGRPRNPSPLYGTTYNDSIGVGVQPARGPVHPRYPNPPVQFHAEGEMLPALDGTLNKSLAQAIASLPAADNILKNGVATHGSYSRDFGHRGHHPLQRNAGLVGGPPVLHAGSMTSGSAPQAYSNTWRAPSHHHNFPSASLIGPSGAKAGPHPIEGINSYPHTSYDVGTLSRSASPSSPAGSEGSPAASSPFTRGGDGRVRGGDGVSVSEMGTTRELFAGSTKHAQVRIPGYAGFIPASNSNALSLKGGPPHGNGPSARDHILEVFSFDMPGYSGHQPKSVVNVRGPRSPRGKKRLNEGLVASLILDSMKI